MKIIRISLHGLELPFREGAYRCRNHTEYGQTATIVRIDTDEGITGWGEIAPLGAFYSEAFTGGVRAGLERLAPMLLDADPRETGKLARTMDAAMHGQVDVKSPLDIALWDISARAAGLPLAEHLGGRDGRSVALYRPVSQASPEIMLDSARRHVAEGYRRLQVKVGDDPVLDATRLQTVADDFGSSVVIFCDANGAWTSYDALRFVERTRGIDYVLEQPCRTLDENLVVRRHAAIPMVLDESADSLEALLRIHRDGMADGITIKISRFGGITRARRIRDLAVDLGLMVTVECVGGADIASAAIAHMSLSTPETMRLHTVDFHNWTTVSNATGLPDVSGGVMRAPSGPGLGVTPRDDVIGEALFSCHAA
ncbi:MAG: mandelate racemase/muconate lactonizing enzyme family protein [Alphaproteobacteria bacterium]|nr:mandelate racemase/muconate lactonizing enzyme family protein [Alphaproteobacteria bacterium]